MGPKKFFAGFLDTHVHPVNRALHLVAALLFLGSVVCLFTHYRWSIVLFVSAIACLGVGHLVDGKPPAIVQRILQKNR